MIITVITIFPHRLLQQALKHGVLQEPLQWPLKKEVLLIAITGAPSNYKVGLHNNANVYIQQSSKNKKNMEKRKQTSWKLRTTSIMQNKEKKYCCRI